MAITAKVKLIMKMDQHNGDVALHFAADYVDGRNKAWATASPSLYYQMLVKREVADLFAMQGAYTVTFTPSE